MCLGNGIILDAAPLHTGMCRDPRRDRNLGFLMQRTMWHSLELCRVKINTDKVWHITEKVIITIISEETILCKMVVLAIHSFFIIQQSAFKLFLSDGIFMSMRNEDLRQRKCQHAYEKIGKNGNIVKCENVRNSYISLDLYTQGDWKVTQRYKYLIYFLNYYFYEKWIWEENV